MEEIKTFAKKHGIQLPFREKALYEAGLSRVKQHAEKRAFFLMSAFRGEYNESQNMRRHKLLMKDLREKDLGYIEMYGHWKENEGTPEEELVSELSLFVPYRDSYTSAEFYAIAVELMEKYEQEAIVYKETETSDIWILNEYEDAVETLGSFHAQKIGQIYSEIKYGKSQGRTFKFESVRVPHNSLTAMTMKKQGYIL